MDTKRFTSRFGRPKADAQVPDAEVAVAAPPADTPSPTIADAPAGEPDAGAVRGAARLVEAETPRAKTIDAEAALDFAKRLAVRARPAAVPAGIAAAVALSLGLGYGLGSAGAIRESETHSAARWLDATADLRTTSADLNRLAAEMRAIRTAVDTMRTERDKNRAELLAKQAQLSERVERATGDTNGRFARMADSIERVERTMREPNKQTAAIAAPAPTPPPKPTADVTQTGSLPDAKTGRADKPEADPRKTQIEGYFVRDVDDGFALVETRSGRFVEVAAGYTVPGLGRIESIERRGRQWVVVTAKGFIGER